MPVVASQFSRHRCLLAACMAPVLSSCLIMTPSPELQALQLVGIAVTTAGAVPPGSPDNPVVHRYDPPKSLCIEYNAAVSIADFVPALQAEFQQHGVESRVYDGGLPETCQYTVHYLAQQSWSRNIFGTDYSNYMSAARLELRSKGSVMAAASYKPGWLGYDKWANTRDKLAPAVRVLVHGNAEGKPRPLASKSP